MVALTQVLQIIIHMPSSMTALCLQYITTPYIINIPNGFPLMQIPSDNPMTVEGVELGENYLMTLF